MPQWRNRQHATDLKSVGREAVSVRIRPGVPKLQRGYDMKFKVVFEEKKGTGVSMTVSTVIYEYTDKPVTMLDVLNDFYKTYGDESIVSITITKVKEW